MKKLCAMLLLGGLVLPSAIGAVDLKQSKFTQVINSVEIISANARRPAEVNDIFQMPDVLRTGSASRAEMVADDGTITRVGANTIFSFDPAERSIDLQQGSLLFHAPHGKGGGTIRTGSATASVLGTTIIVTTTPSGGFKILDLEGEAEVRFLNGWHEKLTPGQMVFVLPGGGTSPIIVFRLDVETQGLLVSGFSDPLPSWPAIEAGITRQLTLLLDNRIIDTDLSVGDNATPQTVQIYMNILNGEKGGNPNAAIIGSDHTPNQSLPINYGPLDPAHTETGPFTPPGNFSEGLAFLGLVTPASGFVGINIDIDTANVNLGAFANNSDFDIMAPGDIKIWQSVDFIGNPQLTRLETSSGLPETVALFAGDTMAIAPDATLEADTGTFGLVAGNFATLDISDGTTLVNNTLEGISILNHYGDVDLLSQSDLTMDDDSYVDADGDVDIQSDGSLTLGDEMIGKSVYRIDFEAEADGSITLSAQGDLTLDDAEANSYDGGGINLNSFGANITLEDFSALYSYDNGTINIDAAQDVTISGGEIIAGGNVNINSGGTEQPAESMILSGENISIDDGAVIEAGQSYSEEGDISYGGSVNIGADSGNIMIIGDSTIEAYSDGSYGGDVNIFAGGTIDVESSYIYADDAVDIESLDALTVNSDGTEQTIEGYNGISLTSETADVDINNYELEADNGDVDITSGTISLGAGLSTSGGNIDIEDSDIEAGDGGSTGGSVNVNAYNGNVTINDANIYAYADGGSESGNVDVYAYGNAGISGSTIEAGGNVEITTGGTLSATADGTDTSGSGAIDIEDSNISAGYDGSEYSSTSGSVDIAADNGGININDSDIYAYSEGSSVDMGSIIIEAGQNVAVGGDTDIFADGNVSITAGNSIAKGESSSENPEIDSEGSYIYAGYANDNYSSSGGSVNITAKNGDVYLYGDDIEAYAGEDSTSGNVNIYAPVGMVGVDDTYIYADNTVDIESSDTLTAFSDITGGNAIDGYYGVTLISDGGDVNVDNYYVEAEHGDVDIKAGGNVYLTASWIYAGYEDMVNGYDADITSSENVSIVTGTTIEASQDVSISAAGSLSAMADGEDAPGSGAIDIEDSYIDAGYNGSEYSDAGGSVHITASNGGINLYDDEIIANSEGTTATVGSINVSAFQNITIEGAAYLYADGNVNITTGDAIAAGEASSENPAIDIEGSFIFAGYADDNYSSAGGSINITAYNGDIYFYNDSVEAYAGKDSTSGNVTVYAPYGSVDLENSYVSAGSDGSDTGADDDATITASQEVTLNDSTINASGDVSITAGQTLYASADLPADDWDISINGSQINAGYGENEAGSVYINAGGNVTIYSTGIYAANDVDIAGDNEVFVTPGDSQSGDTIDIENSSINAGYYSSDGGGIIITANNGNAYLYNDSMDAASGDSSDGDINVSADGNINVLYTGLSTSNGGQVSLVSNYGYVNVLDSYESPDLPIEDWQVQAATDVTLTADRGLSIDDSQIDAYGGDVTITAGQGDEIPYPSTGDEYTSPGYEGFTASTIAPGITIRGNDAYTGPVSGDGQIDGYTGTIDLEGNTGASITSQGLIGETGNVQITADTGGVDIETSPIIQAADGSVDITAPGTVTISDSELEADNGAVEIMAGADVNITDGTINASEDVTINSTSGDITINEGRVSDAFTSDFSGGIDIYAGGDITLSGESVNVQDAELYGLDDVTITGTAGNVNLSDVDVGAYYGNITIDAVGGTLTLGEGESSVSPYLEAGYAVSLTGDNGVTISDSTIYSDDGDLQISSMGDATTGISISDSDVEADGNLSMTSEGEISVSEDISAGGIYAWDGDVTINSVDNDVSISDSYIEASGNVNISSGGLGGLTGDGSPAEGILITGSGIFADNGDISANANSDIEINDSELSAGNNLTMDGADVDIESSGIFADGNLIEISAPNGTVDIENSDIEAGEDDNISITGKSSVVASGNVYIMANSGTINVIGDDVSIYETTFGLDGGISISDSTITAQDGNVDITTEGTLSIDSTDTESVSGLTFEGGEIGIMGSSITADSGDVDIENQLSIAGVSSGISVDNMDITINDSGIFANADAKTGEIGGNINISTPGNIAIENGSTVEAENDVNIGSGESLALESDSSSSGYGDVTIDSSLIEAGYQTINGGSATIDAGGNVNVQDSTLNASADVNITAGGTVNIASTSTSDTSVSGGGNVTVNAGTGLTVSGAAMTANADSGTVTLNNTSGQTTVNNSSTVQAYYININSDDGILIDGTGGHLSGNQLNLTAGNAADTDEATVKNADLTGFASVNIASHTLDIENTKFAGDASVNLGSESGVLNINNGVKAFDINLITDFYGSTEITSSSQFTSGYSTSSGLHNYIIP